MLILGLGGGWGEVTLGDFREGMASKPDAEGDTETQTDRGPGRIFSKTHQFSDVWSSKYEAAVDFEKGEELGGGKRGGKV